jgi:hypothetical protein
LDFERKLYFYKEEVLLSFLARSDDDDVSLIPLFSPTLALVFLGSTLSQTHDTSSFTTLRTKEGTFIKQYRKLTRREHI